jgi:hypothetical protein
MSRNQRKKQAENLVPEGALEKVSDQIGQHLLAEVEEVTVTQMLAIA